MSPSTNKQSRPTTSTTTLALVTSNSSSVIQTNLYNTMNILFENLNDKFDKQDKEMESISELIENHNAKIDKRTRITYSPYHPRPQIFHPNRATKPRYSQLMKTGSKK